MSGAIGDAKGVGLHSASDEDLDRVGSIGTGGGSTGGASAGNVNCWDR